MSWNVKDNWLRIHIPKTAGTSIGQALEKGNHTRGLEFYYFITNNTLSKWDDIYTFTFVREPWDRFISGHYHLRNKMDIDTRIALVEKLASQTWMNKEIEIVFKPQWYFTNGKNAGKRLIRNIYYFEDLQNEWKRLLKTLGREYVELPHRNKREDRPTAEELYTPERYEKIQRIYRRDYEEFYPHLIPGGVSPRRSKAYGRG